MADKEWTKEQLDAIFEKNKNILVAAAAGSGKTTVLVERIINKIINENVDIDKLLVVTFTNAAASEMKQRVLDAIYKQLDKKPDDENLQKQVLLLNKASICTIDSFCLDVVRNNFFELENVSPNFKIADAAQIEILQQETLEELFEEKYEEENEDFLELINTYTSYKDDTPLKELILNIFKNISSMPYPLKWLDEHIEMFNLKDSLDNDFALTPWRKVLLKNVEENLVENIKVLENLKKKSMLVEDFEKVTETLLQDIALMETLKSNINSWDKLYNIYSTNKLTNWPKFKTTNPLKDELKAVRDSVKKKYNDKIGPILLNDSKQANLDIYEMYELLIKLKNLINEFIALFTKKKQEKNIIDFSDVEHFALNILLKEDESGNLVKTEVAEKYTNKFVEIAIDEYQDSNEVQELILTSISKGNNLYMVGDVKQSIYKFRQAMPEIFLKKYNSYKLLDRIKEIINNVINSNLDNNSDNTKDSENFDIKELKKIDINSKIQLYQNFRSRKNILDFTNLVFQNIMSTKLGDIDYVLEEYLHYGAKDYKEINQDLSTEIDIIDLSKQEQNDENESNIINEIEEKDNENIETDSKEINNQEQNHEETYENIELEAKLVAKKIKELINNKFQVYDRKKEEFRTIKYSDIAILLRSTKDKANIYEQELINQDIPVFSDVSQEYLASIEIQTIMSLLKIIDNPIQDIPLVTVMRSSIGKFTDDELVQIRLSDKQDNFYNCIQKTIINADDKLKEKIEMFLENLKKWRKEQEYLALDELIWKIYSDTGFYNYCGLMPNGNLRQANLKFLFEKAKQFEQASLKGLYNFINFIDKLKVGNSDMGSAKLIGENDDVVRIMSIHKSKGLEFPVVFLANINKQFNMRNINEDKILIHNELGLGIKYINHDLQIEYDTSAKTAVKSLLETESISEEMRVLYVALTRAKEKLFIIGLSKDIQTQENKIKEQTQIYAKENGKINYILLKKCKTYFDWLMLIKEYNAEEFNKLAKLNRISKESVLEKEIVEENNIDVCSLMDNHEIDKEQLEKIEKIIEYKYPYSVSTITPTKTSVSELKKINNSSINNIQQLVKPQFLNNQKEVELTGAQKGTIMHMCLQKLDPRVDYTKELINSMIDDMLNKNIIGQKEKDSINQNKIYQFTKSNIWKDMQNAKKIYKEKPFYIEVDANMLEETNKTDKILVQGIIDLFYINENDEIVLVDYKTDFVEKNENELIIKYKTQLELYKQALEKSLNKRVSKVYIYSLYLDKEIELD